MRLYYAPGACSLAAHIVLRETRTPFTLSQVNLATHRLPDGTDFYTLTPKGQVPLLETDAGEHISEGPVVMQFVADQADAPRLLPPAGTMARVRVLEWCNHLTSEVHKSFTPIFHRVVDADATATLMQGLKAKLAFLDRHLATTAPFLTGADFTIADAYLFVLLGWAPHIRLDLSDLPNLTAFQQRVAERPAVREAMRAEGLATN